MSQKEDLLKMYSIKPSRHQTGKSNILLILLSIIVVTLLIFASANPTGSILVTIFLTMALPFGLGGYYVGRRTGNGLEGFWFGCILGPIGLVIAFVLDDKTREECSSCSESIKISAKVCPYCGTSR